MKILNKYSMRLRRRVLVVLILVGAVVSILWYIGMIGGNIREVVPGRVYRSAQLTGHNLDDVFESDHIRTDINLRGGSIKDEWYRSEVSSCRQFGVTHIDISMSAYHLPPPEQLNKLLDSFDHARYPLLFHCEGGADRSGFVGTLYLNVYQHVPLQQAESSELTWRYGHLSWSKARAMNDFYALYNKTNDGMDLRSWIHSRYPSLYASQK